MVTAPEVCLQFAAQLVGDGTANGGGTPVWPSLVASLVALAAAGIALWTARQTRRQVDERLRMVDLPTVALTRAKLDLDRASDQRQAERAAHAMALELARKLVAHVNGRAAYDEVDTWWRAGADLNQDFFGVVAQLSAYGQDKVTEFATKLHDQHAGVTFKIAHPAMHPTEDELQRLGHLEVELAAAVRAAMVEMSAPTPLSQPVQPEAKARPGVRRRWGTHRRVDRPDG
jgi:hypothetical protein